MLTGPSEEREEKPVSEELAEKRESLQRRLMLREREPHAYLWPQHLQSSRAYEEIEEQKKKRNVNQKRSWPMKLEKLMKKKCIQKRNEEMAYQCERNSNCNAVISEESPFPQK